MSMTIQVTITGNQETQAKLRRLGTSLHDYSRAMRDIGNQLSHYYMTQGFLSQGGVFSAKWPRLSMPYAGYKARRWPGRPPLVRTGKMISGFKSTSNSSSVLITNRMPYFKYHQLGTGWQGMATRERVAIARAIRGVGGGGSIGRGNNLPQRKMMGVNKPVRDTVTKIVHDDIRRKLRTVK